MFGLGSTELIIILVLVLIIFGAGKLPQVGGALGKGMRNFKDGIKEGNDEKEEKDKDKLEENKSDQYVYSGFSFLSTSYALPKTLGWAFFLFCPVKCCAPASGSPQLLKFHQNAPLSVSQLRGEPQERSARTCHSKRTMLCVKVTVLRKRKRWRTDEDPENFP